jgi:hypothetical protein
MGDAGRQIFGAGGKQNDAKGGPHKSLENLTKMGAGPGIEAGKRFVEEQQAGGAAKSARQLEALGFTIGQGKNRAVEEWLKAEVLDEPALEAIELRTSSLSLGAGISRGNFEGIEFEDMFVGKEATDGAAGSVLEAVPPGLDDGVVELRATVFKGDMGDGFFPAQAWRGTEMAAQVSPHERQVTAEGIGEE